MYFSRARVKTWNDLLRAKNMVLIHVVRASCTREQTYRRNVTDAVKKLQ